MTDEPKMKKYVVLRGEGLGELLSEEEGKRRLEGAMERGRERGRKWVAEFRASSFENKREYIASEIYERLFGYEMGAIYFDELPPVSTHETANAPDGSWINDRPLVQETYYQIAGHILTMLFPPEE